MNFKKVILFVLLINFVFSCNLNGDVYSLKHLSIIYDFIKPVTEFENDYTLDENWDNNNYVVLDPDYADEIHNNEINYPVFVEYSDSIEMINFDKKIYTKKEFKDYINRVNLYIEMNNTDS